MSDLNNARLLARYRMWADRLTFDAVAALPPGEAAKERPTLFKTMIGTLNHNYVIDLIWQAHLEGRDHGFQARNLVLHDSLPELAAVTREARIFVGVDSAPMHIAAAMQTPVIALFGPSGEFEWGPWRVPHRIITSMDHPCRPCGIDGCGGGKISECFTTLPVERVCAALTELINATDASGGVALRV